MVSKRRFFWFWIFFALVSCLFLAGTALLPIASQGEVFVSPDETANAFFARHFAESGSMRIQDAATKTFENQLYPRSVLATSGVLLPQSFLGLPVLYGMFSYIFGPESLYFITPIFTILAALALRSILQKWFSSIVSNLSAILFLVHPAVWYYSARGLMHNMLFVSLLIFAAYVFLRHPISHHLERCAHRLGKLRTFQRHADCFFAGVLIGFALFVRTSEVYWVGAGLLILTIMYGRKWWKEISRLWVGIIVGCLPILIFQALTYGHPFITGYTVGASARSVQRVSSTLFETSELLFPFGIDLSAAGEHVLDYGLLLFWWLSFLALIGFAVIAYKYKRYALSFLMLALWLGVWYGSWTLYDNPDATQVTIANSYIRYWLPVFIATIPFVAEGMLWIADRARSRVAKRFCVIALVLLVCGLNVRAVFFEGQDALIRVADVLSESRQIKTDVLSRTPMDAVIVVDRADKLFFPQRRVRYPLRSDETYTLMPRIAESYPLYYFGITLPEKDMTFLNTSKLLNLGLQIEWVETYGEESLYEIGIREL